MEDEESTVSLDSESLSAQLACPKRYAVKSLIGQGGMGMVFRALDQELGRDVAIKVLLLEDAKDAEAQERFTRESKALAMLDHPNILQIYSAGITEQGNPYTVMEYLEGESLAQKQAREPVGAGEFLELFKQVLAGLKHAHSNKIAHRDLKPTNIMRCTSSDGRITYKVIDFGIARLESSSANNGKTLTRTNAILGSPAYMSPEQCRGERGDFLSDMYSLGIIMYECIAGELPFKGETAFETMYKQMSEGCPRLDRNSKASAAKKLADLVQKCLSKEPGLRPQCIEEIETELKELAEESLENSGLFSPKKKRKTLSTRGYILAPLAVVLLVFVVAAAYKTYIKATCSVPLILRGEDKLINAIKRQAAIIEPSKATAASIKDPGLRDRYLNTLLELGQLQLQSSHNSILAEAETTFSQGLNYCDVFPAQFGSRRAAFLTYRAKAMFLQGKTDKAKQELEKAISIADKAALPDILLERCALLIRDRGIKGASKDYIAVEKEFHKISGDLDKVAFFMPVLDKRGVLRCRLFDKISDELCKFKVRSATDAIEVTTFADQLAPFLNEIHHTDQAKQIMFYVSPELEKIPGHEELKQRTRDLARSIAIS